MFWLAAYIPKFVQVGVWERWDQNGFLGWKGFYASEYDVDARNPDFFKPHEFELPLLSAGNRAYLRVGKHENGWRVSFEPKDQSVDASKTHADIPGTSSSLTNPNMTLESFEQAMVQEWNLSNYTAFIPSVRYANGKSYNWPHGRVEIHHTEPPQYIGVYVVKPWYSFGTQGARAVEMGHLGGLPTNRREFIW